MTKPNIEDSAEPLNIINDTTDGRPFQEEIELKVLESAPEEEMAAEDQPEDLAAQETNIEFLKPRSVNLADNDAVSPDDSKDS